MATLYGNLNATGTPHEYNCPSGKIMQRLKSQYNNNFIINLSGECSDGTKLPTLGSYVNPDLPVYWHKGPFTSIDGRANDQGVYNISGNGLTSQGNEYKMVCPLGSYITGIKSTGDKNLNNIGFNCGYANVITATTPFTLNQKVISIRRPQEPNDKSGRITTEFEDGSVFKCATSLDDPNITNCVHITPKSDQTMYMYKTENVPQYIVGATADEKSIIYPILNNTPVHDSAVYALPYKPSDKPGSAVVAQAEPVKSNTTNIFLYLMIIIVATIFGCSLIPKNNNYNNR